MTTDDHLTDLLAERASQGSRVHPTMDGVQDAIARRGPPASPPARSSAAAWPRCASWPASPAASPSRRAGTTPRRRSTADLPEVPLVGVDRAGPRAGRDPRGSTSAPAPTRRSATPSFADPADRAGPVMTAVIGRTRPVDGPRPAGRSRSTSTATGARRGRGRRLRHGRHSGGAVDAVATRRRPRGRVRRPSSCPKRSSSTTSQGLDRGGLRRGDDAQRPTVSPSGARRPSRSPGSPPRPERIQPATAGPCRS